MSAKELKYSENARSSILAGVKNIFDKKPPKVTTIAGADPINAFAQVPTLGTYYDYYGRQFFLSLRAKLGDLGLGL